QPWQGVGRKSQGRLSVPAILLYRCSAVRPSTPGASTMKSRVLQGHTENPMAGTPESTVILHWDKCEAVWAELSWRDWVRFRGFDESGFRHRGRRTVLSGLRARRSG